MSDNKTEFRVGLFVLLGTAAFVGLVIRLEDLAWFWEPQYVLSIRLTEAPGVGVGTPVRSGGLGIGKVSEIAFDAERAGVIVKVEVRAKYKIRSDSKPLLSRSLLGDASIDFPTGISPKFHENGAVVDGVPPIDPIQLVARMEKQVSTTLVSFSETSNEWRKVAANVNSLMETNRGNIDEVVERAATALAEITETMKGLNAIVGDPENQKRLQATLDAIPKLVDETRRTVLTVRQAVAKIDTNLENLQNVTGPLAEKSASIVTKLDNSVGNLEQLLAELNHFSRNLNTEDGSLTQLAKDPHLYRNLNKSAASLALLLKKLEPTIEDMRIFSDKVARHPELIGVGGAIRPSAGTKN